MKKTKSLIEILQRIGPTMEPSGSPEIISIKLF